MSLEVPKILEVPPEEIEKELTKLREELDNEIPKKILDKNLLIATWNIRCFGGLTEKWASTQNDSPKRDLHALRCIAEIISRFDVIAIQEVRGQLKALRHMLKVLGPNWGFVLTDVTEGHPDEIQDERMAFLFDTRKVQMSGLACELVVPRDKLNNIGENALREQFARTPYAVSFRAGGSPIKRPKTFILVTLHVIWEEKPDHKRVQELKAIADWLAEWAKSVNAYDHNLIALGDFNIDREAVNFTMHLFQVGFVFQKIFIMCPVLSHQTQKNQIWINFMIKLLGLLVKMTCPLSQWIVFKAVTSILPKLL